MEAGGLGAGTADAAATSDESGVVGEGVFAKEAGLSRMVFGGGVFSESGAGWVGWTGGSVAVENLGFRRSLVPSPSTSDMEVGAAAGTGLAGIVGTGAAASGADRVRGFNRNGGGDSSLISARL